MACSSKGGRKTAMRIRAIADGSVISEQLFQLQAEKRHFLTPFPASTGLVRHWMIRKHRLLEGV